MSSMQKSRQKIVIPHNVTPGLLHHLHNNRSFQTHPFMNQLKMAFQWRFYTWSLQPLIDSLYPNCYTCSVSQTQPRIKITDETKTVVKHPHRQYHFSTLSNAMLLHNKQAVDLKQGLIQLSTAVRHPGKITISTDNTPAFVALYKRTEKKQLNDLEIKIKPKDEFNKN